MWCFLSPTLHCCLLFALNNNYYWHKRLILKVWGAHIIKWGFIIHLVCDSFKLKSSCLYWLYQHLILNVRPEEWNCPANGWHTNLLFHNLLHTLHNHFSTGGKAIDWVILQKFLWSLTYFFLASFAISNFRTNPSIHRSIRVTQRSDGVT